jgi:hypothetical protein
MNVRAAIEIRRVPNDLLLEMQEQLAGLYVSLDFLDHRGCFVSGKLVSARQLDPQNIGVTVDRYMKGEYVKDGACISSGSSKYRTDVHIPVDHPALAAIEGAAAARIAA